MRFYVQKPKEGGKVSRKTVFKAAQKSKRNLDVEYLIGTDKILSILSIGT